MNEAGATALEYALLAMLISAAAVGGYTAYADSMNTMWGSDTQPIRKSIDG